MDILTVNGNITSNTGNIKSSAGNIIAENGLIGGAVFQSTGDVIAGGN